MNIGSHCSDGPRVPSGMVMVACNVGGLLMHADAEAAAVCVLLSFTSLTLAMMATTRQEALVGGGTVCCL